MRLWVLRGQTGVRVPWQWWMSQDTTFWFMNSTTNINICYRHHETHTRNTEIGDVLSTNLSWENYSLLDFFEVIQIPSVVQFRCDTEISWLSPVSSWVYSLFPCSSIICSSLQDLSQTTTDYQSDVYQIGYPSHTPDTHTDTCRMIIVGS